MPANTPLQSRYPALDRRLQKADLATLPTPARSTLLRHADHAREIAIKYDNLTSELYGGNKVRKLEYLLRPVTRKRISRFATFGTVGSNHALATALYSRELGFECTCFLAHQRKTGSVSQVLNMHLKNGTEIVRYGGAYARRIRAIRDSLWHRQAWVVPAGGSSWVGTVGFVNAGLEIAAQVERGEIPAPDRLYVATGTMGTAAGLALGLALAGLGTEVHAIRVSHTDLCNEESLTRLMRKTASMMRRLDGSIPESLAERVNVRLRHSFFAGGYAHSDADTEYAIRLAREQLGLRLEPTYTGKSMAALLNDIQDGSAAGEELLFWNTYNSTPLPVTPDLLQDHDALPQEFLSYFA